MFQAENLVSKEQQNINLVDFSSFRKISNNLLYLYLLDFNVFAVLFALSMHSPKIRSILGISIFKKSEMTVESNRSADRVRKKRPPSHFAVAT